jgi:S1-C subfamily serine protease
MQKINKTALMAIVVFTILGFVSGVIGELWLNSFLLPDPYLNFQNYSDLSKRLDDLVSVRGDKQTAKSPQDIAVAETVNKIQPVIVRIYKTKKFSANSFGSLMSQDFLAMGTVITSDGWILSSEKNLNERDSYLVVTADNKIYETKEVNLAYPGAVFLKIDAVNLPVAQFDSRKDLVGGQTVILFGGTRGITMTEIKNNNYAKLEEAVDFVHSSEEFYKFISLENNLGKDFVGSPVITLSGRVVGVFGDVDGVVVPADYLVKSMKSIGQAAGKVTRASLGVRFYDLSEILNSEIKEQKGAMILKDKKLAFVSNSPAINVFLPGDIILKVEGEEINARRNLTEVIAEYKTGEKLKFLVKRGGEEKTVEVVLN